MALPFFPYGEDTYANVRDRTSESQRQELEVLLVAIKKNDIFHNQECNLLNFKGSVDLMENQKNRASILFPFSLIEQRVGRLRTVEQMRLYSRL